MKCAEGVSPDDPYYASLRALQSSGEALQKEGPDLKTALSSNGVKSSESSFTYESGDAFKDFTTRNEKTWAKTEFGLQLVGGIGETVIGVGTGIAGCPTSVLCFAASYMIVDGPERVHDGVVGLASDYTYKNGLNVNNSFSLTTYGGGESPLLDTYGRLALGNI